MTASALSLEELIRNARRALVIGVGGGGDVVGALASARFLEFCGVECLLGGLSWERNVYDPLPGPRKLADVLDVKPLHEFAWIANARSRTKTGVAFTESKMAGLLGKDILLVDINGGAQGAAAGLIAAIEDLRVDLLVGIDVGGDSLSVGNEPGLRSPLADAVMLAALAALARRGQPTLWGVLGYGSDGELTTDEIELAISKIAKAGGLLGCWALTPKIAAELREVIKTVPTEASALPVDCFYGAWGRQKIRGGQRHVRLTPLTTLTFYMAVETLYDTLSRPAEAVSRSQTLDQANDALHALGIGTELDYEREHYSSMRPK